MILANRLLLGVLLGSLLVSFIHPASRPYLLQPELQHLPPSSLTGDAARRDSWASLPDPDSPVTASLWMEVGLADAGHQSKDQLLLLVEIAQTAGEEDRRNAFWPQAEAVFQEELRNRDASLRAWAEASRRSRWNDLQTDRLEGLISRLDEADHAPLSWHRAAALASRTSESCVALSRFGKLLSSRFPDSKIIAKENVLNGALIRDSGGSLDAMELGQSLIDSSIQTVFPASSASQGLSQLSYENPEAASTLAKAKVSHRGNAVQEARRQTASASALSAAAASIEAGFLVCILSMTVVALIGSPMASFPRLQALLRPPYVFGLSLLTFAVLYGLGRMVFPSLWASLCIAALALEPERVWPDPPARLEPSFLRFQRLLAVASVLCGSIGLCASSSAWQAVKPLTNSGPIESAAAALLNCAFLAGSLGIGVSVLWAFRGQRKSAAVVPMGLREFGLAGIWAGMIAFAAILPLVIITDRQLSIMLEERVQNPMAGLTLPN